MFRIDRNIKIYDPWQKLMSECYESMLSTGYILKTLHIFMFKHLILFYSVIFILFILFLSCLFS